jgi:hypothetical protein
MKYPSNVPSTSPELVALYLEFEPATDSVFAIGAGNYRTAMIDEIGDVKIPAPPF